MTQFWKKYPALISSITAAAILLGQQLSTVKPLTWQAAIPAVVTFLVGVLIHSQVSSPATVEKILSDAQVATQVGASVDAAFAPFASYINKAIVAGIADANAHAGIVRSGS